MRLIDVKNGKKLSNGNEMKTRINLDKYILCVCVCNVVFLKSLTISPLSPRVFDLNIRSACDIIFPWGAPTLPSFLLVLLVYFTNCDLFCDTLTHL